MNIAVMTTSKNIMFFKYQLAKRNINVLFVVDDAGINIDINETNYIDVNDINIYNFEKNKDFKYEFLFSYDIDLSIVYGWSSLIPLTILEKIDFYNFHPSLLPKYRGPQPIIYQLFNEESISGVTLHKMNEKFDAGPIFMQKSFLLAKNETYKTIFIKTFRCISDILTKFFDAYLNGTIVLYNQDESEATYQSFKDLSKFIIDNNLSYNNFLKIYNLREFMAIKVKIEDNIYILKSFSNIYDDFNKDEFLLKDKKIFINIEN